MAGLPWCVCHRIMENSCEELSLIWGQREQDEVYSTSEMIEDCTVHLPVPAANVFIGLRFYFGEGEDLHAGPACSHASFSPCVLSLPGSISLYSFGEPRAKSPWQLRFLLPRRN